MVDLLDHGARNLFMAVGILGVGVLGVCISRRGFSCRGFSRRDRVFDPHPHEPLHIRGGTRRDRGQIAVIERNLVVGILFILVTVFTIHA